MLGNLTEIPASNTQKKMFYIELLLFLLFSEHISKDSIQMQIQKKIITYYKRKLSRKQKAKFCLLNISKGWPY